jgi:membrane-bound metal-dependent hydrolase YbcI (DUF457 family)
MLNKTHIAIGIFFMLFFINKVTHIWTYIFIFALATLLPNLDKGLTLGIGRKNDFGRAPTPRKRGMLHSFTFCLAVTVVLAWFLPTLSLPFFLAYGTHLIADSWTTEGIRPFWPARYIAKGSVRQGGSIEHMIFYSFVFADIILAWILLF